MSEETSTSSSECIRDGILDVFYDLSQLTNKERWKYTRLYLCLVDFHARLTTASNLQLQFDLYFLEHPKRSCVKAVKEWKKDGMVSVATTACLHCIMINNARPYPSRRPSFSCLVRSRPDIGTLRSDGSQICACCSATSRTSCRAWGGTHHKETPDADKYKDRQGVAAVRSGQDNALKRHRGEEAIQDSRKTNYHILDEGSDLSSIEGEDSASDDSSVPLMEIAKKRSSKVS